MDGSHKPLRLVCANGYDRHQWRKTLTNLFEGRWVVSCISCKVYVAMRRLDHIAAPKSSVTIEKATATEVLCWNRFHINFLCHLCARPPIEINEGSNSKLFQESSHAEWFNKHRVECVLQCSDGSAVEVVVMIMA